MKSKIAFVGIVLVCVGLVLYVSRISEEAHDASVQATEAISHINELRRARAADTTMADIQLCKNQNENREAVRKVSRILLASLRAASTRMGDDPVIQRVFKEQIAVLEDQLENLHPEDCDDLPSQ